MVLCGKTDERLTEMPSLKLIQMQVEGLSKYLSNFDS